MRKLYFIVVCLALVSNIMGCGREPTQPTRPARIDGEVKPVPEKAHMKTSGDLSPEADKFLADATAEFNPKQAAMQRDWKLDSHKQWGYDQTTGVLKLEYADGAELHADGQILGSHSAADGTWEWAWNNPNSLPAVSRDSTKVRDAGKKYGIDYLQAGIVPVPNQEYVAYLCGIGLKATDSIGIYRGKAGPIDVYIMLKNPRWAKKGT